MDGLLYRKKRIPKAQGGLKTWAKAGSGGWVYTKTGENSWAKQRADQTWQATDESPTMADSVAVNWRNFSKNPTIGQAKMRHRDAALRMGDIPTRIDENGIERVGGYHSPNQRTTPWWQVRKKINGLMTKYNIDPRDEKVKAATWDKVRSGYNHGTYLKKEE